MQRVLFLFASLFLLGTAYSQKVDNSTFERISKQLIDESLNAYCLANENVERQEDCIIGKEDGFTLSCIQAEWDINWVTDFDGDSIDDIVIKLTDEGLGGGGNAFDYHFHIVLLTKDGNVKKVYTLFGGGKMSYVFLSIDSVGGGTINTTCEKNPYVYGVDEVGDEGFVLAFYIEDGELLESNYARCSIAEMNKNVFKDNLNFKITRESSLDASYNIKQEEWLYLEDGTYYNSSISGCEDIDLHFTRTIPYEEHIERDEMLIKMTLLEYLKFLKENTRYKTVLNELHEKLNNLNSTEIERTKHGSALVEFSLNNDWEALVFMSFIKEQGSSRITTRLSKLTEAEPLEFWEALKKARQ